MKKIILIILSMIFILNAEILFEIKDSQDSTVFSISDDGLRVMNLGDTLMVISATEIRANLDSQNKALSRSFSVSTNASGKGNKHNVLEVTTGSTTMREGDQGSEYTDFSPENIFLGLSAGEATYGTGVANVFVGNNAGFSNTTGSANVFIGEEAGYSNLGMSSNTYVGHIAGRSSTGNMNAFFGYAAGTSNVGNQNTYIGQNAGSVSVQGSDNTFLGYSAGVDCEGDENVMLGSRAGYYNQSGSGNIFLGYKSGEDETGSNKLYIDNSDTATPLIYGEFDNNVLVFNSKNTQVIHPVGNTTNGLFIQSTYNSNTDSWHFYQATTDHLNLFYNTYLRGTWDLTSGAYTASSDKKLKKNFEDMSGIMDKVMKLQPKRYNFISQNDGDKKYIGLIAQDVKELFPEFILYNDETETYTMDYAGLSVVAIQAVKELKDENNELKSRLEKLEKAVESLK